MSSCHQVQVASQVAVKCPVPFRFWLQFVQVHILPYYLTLITHLVNFDYFVYTHLLIVCLLCTLNGLDFRYVLDNWNGTGYLTAT